jgi:alpha-L-fucosidase
MKRPLLALVFLCVAARLFSLPAEGDKLPTPGWPAADPAAVAHWRSLRFGMFIHWGPVSLTGREIGWSRANPTPVEVYDQLYRQFNPTNFNADEWVGIARAAGMKYIVLTTKHHDGFCLWDTKFTDYNIMHSPFRRDVVQELAAACKRQGIEFGAYYSTCDWYNTNWPTTSPGGKVKREKSDLDAYKKYLQGQITELMQNYGPLITIWNDVPNRPGAEFGKRGAETIRMARQLQPSILINDRTGDGGDYDTPEQKIGKFQLDRPWESCMTVSAHNQWAWGGTNDGVKSTAACLEMLIRGAGGDGNILLNVGPRPDGVIDPAQANLLKDMGAWLARYGDSIYGTRGGPWKPTPAIASTRKGNTVFLHVLRAEGGRVELPDIPARIVSASLLGGGPIGFTQQNGRLVVNLPAALCDPLDTIVRLELDKPALAIPPIEAESEPR